MDFLCIYFLQHLANTNVTERKCHACYRCHVFLKRSAADLLWSDIYTGFGYIVGVPNRNDNHVTETATLALDLLHVMNQMSFPYNITRSINIRIGIHSGNQFMLRSIKAINHYLFYLLYFTSIPHLVSAFHYLKYDQGRVKY